MRLLYLAVALDTYGTVRFTAILAISFIMVGMAYYSMPNFGVLAPLHVPEQVPVVLQVGPG